MQQAPRPLESRHRPKEARMWQREYLPGYTGFVPVKSELFGKTAGTINREINASGGNETNMGRIALKQIMMGQQIPPAQAKINKDVFGNHSKLSQNWISGPTHMMRRQEVPGYTGHIRGMVNKDSISKSYAKVTATLFSKKHPIMVDNTAKGRFSSTQRDEYRLSNNRRFALNKDLVSRKDYDDYSKYINEAHGSRKELLTGGMNETQTRHKRQAKSSMQRQTPSIDVLATQTTRNAGPFFNARNSQSTKHLFGSQTMSITNTVKPRILESKVSENPDFYNLSDGFKKIFANDKKDMKIIVPVVGYGGHRRGERCQNYFGKSYRDTTIQSKSLERSMRTRSSHAK